MTSPVLWYATRATGVTALVLLSATMVLGLLTASRAASTRWPGVTHQDLHRRLSLLTVLFVAGHVLTSVLDSFVHIGWVAIAVPFASHYKASWVGLGTIGLDLLFAVVVTSILRRRLPARLWRGVHWLAYLSWPVAVAHAIGIGTDMRLHWVLYLTLACVAAVTASAGWRATLRAALKRRVSALPAVRHRAVGVPIKHRTP